MQLLAGIDGLRKLPPGGVISVGNFDGIHLGHRRLVELARELRQTDGGGVGLVTFEPHPLTVLRPDLAPPRLTPESLKRQLLAELGIDHLVTLAPTPEVLNLTAESFWSILRDDVRPRHMIEGETFTFGKGRGGNIHRLKEWAFQSPVTLHILQPVKAALLDLTVVDVSSSLIRWLIAYGRMRDAAICLSRPYALHGEVVKGFERGRELGIPTANLKITEQMIPPDGVYSGRCAWNGETYIAAISIGTAPTFAENVRQVEVHLIDFSDDLYGETLSVEVTDWIREQRKYSGVDALLSQMRVDLERIKSLVTLDPARQIAKVG